MRESLTILASLVIVVLTAALVGPYLVDWSAQRGLIEAKLSKAIGATVRVDGDIDLRLLPSPRLILTGVTAGGSSKQNAVVSVKDTRVELAVAALLRGEFNFTEATFDGLRLKLTQAKDGGFTLPRKFLLGREKAQFDKIAVRHGTFVVDAGAAGEVTFQDVDLDAQAASFLGPFKGSGSLQAYGRPVAFRFSTGAVEQDHIRAKLVVDEAPGVPHVDLDGNIAFQRPGTDKSAGAGKQGGAVSYDGALTLSGSLAPAPGSSAPPLPWRISGNATAGLTHVSLDPLDVSLGSDVRQLSATGAVDIQSGEPGRLRVKLVAKQLDVDHVLGGPAPVRPRDVAAAIRAGIEGRGPFPLPAMLTNVDVTVASAAVGGDVVSDVSAKLGWAPDQPVAGHFEANGPGHSRIVSDGTLEGGPAAAYNGHLDASTRDSARLAAWLGQGDPDFAPRVAALLPLKAVSLAGDMEISGVSYAGRNLTATLDRSSLAGTLAYTAAIGQEHARLYADVSSDRLDVDAVPGLSLAALAGSDLDFAIHVASHAVKLTRAEGSDIETGAVDLDAKRTNGETVLDHLSIAGLGGASLQAHGTWGSAGARLNADLDAADLGGFAELARHVVPGAASDMLQRRAAMLSPAKLSLLLLARPDGSVNSVTLDGTAGTTAVKGSLQRSGSDLDVLDLAARLDGVDTSEVLRQIGMPVTPVPGLGQASIALTARGKVGGGDLDGRVDAMLSGSEVTWQGRVSPATGAADGTAAVRSVNVAPLLQALSVLPSGSTSGPSMDLTGEAGLQEGRLSLRNLKGFVATTRVGGDLVAQSVERGPDGAEAAANYRVGGALSLDRLPAAAVAALAFGHQPPSPDGRWSKARFTPQLVAPPATDLALQIGAATLGNVEARDLSLKLTLDAGVMQLADIAGTLGDGKLSGSATVRRDAASATLAGHLELEGISVAKPFFGGVVSGKIDVAGAGDSAAALMGGLAGQGAVSLVAARFPTVDPGSMTRVVGAVNSERLALDGETIGRTLTAESGRSGLEAVMLQAPVTVTGGVVRLGPVAVPDPRASVTVTAAVDPQSLTLDMDTDVQLKTSPKEWTGQPPQMTISWRGPLAAPARQVDSSPFVNGLTARALAINLQHLQDLDFDIRERAFFNRRLKAIQEDELRERERVATQQLAVRHHFEEDRRRAEERAEQAAQDARRQTKAIPDDGGEPASINLGIPPPRPAPDPVGLSGPAASR